MKNNRWVFLTFFLLTACSSDFLSQGKEAYLFSRNAPNLQVPPPLTDANISHFYDLPDQNQKTYRSIVPPATS